MKLEIDPVIEAYKKDVDRTLLIENLRRSVDQRVQRAQNALNFALEVQRAGAQMRAKK